MIEKILLNDEKYSGQYVAFKNKDEHIVVGSGKTPQAALDEAVSKGYPQPILLFVPERNSVHIY